MAGKKRKKQRKPRVKSPSSSVTRTRSEAGHLTRSAYEITDEPLENRNLKYAV